MGAMYHIKSKMVSTNCTLTFAPEEILSNNLPWPQKSITSLDN
jgi:hypothetical protein